jgi:MoxR-like ATPase
MTGAPGAFAQREKGRNVNGDIAAANQTARAIAAQLNRLIVGKESVVEQAVVTLLSGGHLLIEDVPGVGKTTLAKGIARAIGGDFKRLQFTPDLLPSDITGTSVFLQSIGDFEFRPGPLFSNVLLVDEVNRATPKTQSALLEAMEERQVTVDGQTRALPLPFFVLATQNNIEMTGTYPLPEAQLDRFFARVSLGYPDRASEMRVLDDQKDHHPLQDLQQAATLEELMAAQRAVRAIHVDEKVRAYIVDVVRATRENAQLLLGASPRGSLYLLAGAQAFAAIEGAASVRPDHVKSAAPLVLGHRVMLRGEVRARGVTGGEVIQQLLATVSVPVLEKAR